MSYTIRYILPANNPELYRNIPDYAWEPVARSGEAVEPGCVDNRSELHAELFIQDQVGEAVAVYEVDSGSC